MALKIGKKGGTPKTTPAAAPEAQAPATPQDQPETSAGGTPPASKPVPFQQPNLGGHLMTGGSQHQAVAQAEAIRAMRAKLDDRPMEFFLSENSFANLYFLDGTLTGEDVFDTPMCATHMIEVGNTWRRIFCLAAMPGGCPICNSGQPRTSPEMRQLFTVINTTPYTIQKGPKAGKTLTARLQLLAVPHKIREKLVHRAKTRGGTLAGHTFEFRRGGKQEPRTGGDIEHVGTYDMTKVIAKYPKLGGTLDEPAPTRPIDYNRAFPLLTAEEIAKLCPQYGGHYGGGGGFDSAPAPGSGLGNPDTDDSEIPF